MGETTQQPSPTRAAARARGRSLVARVGFAATAAAAVALVAWEHVPFLWSYYQYHPRHGDIVFQSLPDGPFVRLIEGSTRSPLSHCGIVVGRDGAWSVLEALGRVRETGLYEWTRRGREGAFLVCRLKPEHEPHRGAFVAEALAFAGTPYDYRFRMDDEAIYCSELAFKAFRAATGEALGRTCRLADLDWRPHEEYIAGLEGGPVPLDRELITPAALARAEQLEVVFDSGRLHAR